MAIGTTAAILGSTLISAAGSALAGGSAKKAANNASQIESQNTDKNNALTREIYERNTGNLTPWMQSGQRATNAIDELLYGPQPVQPAPQPSSVFGGVGRAQPSVFGSWGGEMSGGLHPMPSYVSADGISYPNMQYGVPEYTDQGIGPPVGPTGGVTAALPARSAFENYLNSTGYQFRFGEGMKGLNIGYGARGLLESGARDKAAIRYGQGVASDEFARYMALLNQQQNLGFSGASALAGVAQNMVGNVTANNNAAAAAAANAALASGNANANMWSSIAGGLGNVFGTLGSSYGKAKI